MNKTLLSALAGCLITIPSHTLADQINIFNWASYLDEDVVEQFENNTGHSIKQDYFASEELRSEVIDSGRGIGFDLILMDDWSLGIMAQKGMFHDVSHLNLNQHNSEFSRKACGNYGIPYAYGTLGLLYRDSVSKQPINSWMDLFEPPVEHEGAISMYADTVDGIAAALLAIKADPFTSDKSTLKQAYQLLQKQAPNVLTYEYGDSYAKQQRTESKFTLSLGYSGDTYVLEEYTDQNDWQYVVPKEGTLIWVECFAFPIGREISPAAISFIQYLQQPEVNIQNAESIWLATPNKAAVKLGSAEYQQDASLFPPDDIIAKSYLYKEISPEGQLIRQKMLQSIR